MTKEEIEEEITTDYDNYFESEEWKSYLEWVSKLKRKTIRDYKEFRRHSNIPYGYIKEELGCMEEVTSVGFISGFNPTKRGGKDVFQIKEEDSERILQDLGELQCNEWFQYAFFNKQWEAYDLPSPKGYSEEEWDTIVYEWEEFVAQRSDYWGDTYYGYIALPMEDGRFWLLYYKC